MRIPEKVKIGGVEYDVEIVDKIGKGNNNDILGLFDVVNMKILIRRSDSSQSMERAFVHEFIHALHSHMGLHQVEDETPSENYVDGLANALHMALIDNPSLFVR